MAVKTFEEIGQKRQPLGFDEIGQEKSSYQVYLDKYGVIDPDNPLHQYDYRAAFKAGVEPIRWRDLPADQRTEDLEQIRQGSRPSISPDAYMWPDKFKLSKHKIPAKKPLSFEEIGLGGIVSEPARRETQPTQMQIGAAPEPTGWQKFKQFFTTDRPPLPPHAGRMAYFDRTFDIAIGSPLRVFLKYAKGRTLNIPDLMWAGIKKITPDSMWDEEVKKMNLDQAMDWAAGYDPSGFQKVTGSLAEFIGRIQTAKQIGQATGVLGTKVTLPKDISKLLRAGEATKLWGIQATAREFTRLLSETIDPQTDYQYEGATGIVTDMGIGAGLSLGSSAIVQPTLAKAAQSAMGRKIIDAADRALINLTKRFPQLMDTVRKNPEKYFIEKTEEYLKYRGIKPTDLTPQQRAVVNHVARESQRRFVHAYKNYVPPPDIVKRAEKPPIPRQITGISPAPRVAKITPVRSPTAIKPTEVAPITPKAPEIVAEGKEKIISAAIKVNNQVFTGDTHTEAFDSARKKLKPDMERLDFIATADIQSSTGFMTSKDRYVESDEALTIAKKAKQETEAIELSIAEAALAKPEAVAPEIEVPTFKTVDEAAKYHAETLAEKVKLGETIYVTPQFRLEVKGKSRLAPSSIYLKVAGLEPAKDLNYWRKPKKKIKGKPGFVDVSAFGEIHKTFMRVLEPSKAVERKLGKEAYAAVIKGVHQTDAKRVEFEQTELPKKDKVINELEEYLDQFSNEDLENLMLSRGEPTTVEAQLIQREAINKLPKELRSPRLTRAIQHIADFNYKYLQSVVGDDINRVADYFYGIYKDSKKVDKFLDFWRTTKRFTKEKKLPTYADAVNYGLEIRTPNPVRNLKAEYVAIAHLEGMNWLKDELMRTGKGKFIDDFIEAPVEWDKVSDKVFDGLRLQPDLAKLINNLISTNKITKVPALNMLRQVNNVLRTVKFVGSAFHLLSVAKQSAADSGYLGFVHKIAGVHRRPGKIIPIGLHKKTATKGLTTGFRKNDPIFKTLQYRDYVKHGGSHRYSMESEAQRAFLKFANKINKEFGKAVKYGAMPLKIPITFVNWMFNSYIPKVKYAKYLDNVVEQEKRLGRPLKSSEKIDILKEQQNFYGMMNERLFGRSGTWTTVLRLFFMAPGYAEGNFRTILKAASQWGFKGFRAGRSRSNIINSFLITSALATVGTMIITGKLPKKPETKEDLRDLFKIDTGKIDDKGRRIMIDLMTYDKDYWNVYGNLFLGEPSKAIESSIKRVGGMTATTAEVAVDLLLISQGRAIYDWKGDRVTEITDPFLRKVMKLAVHEIKKTEPISWSVFKQSKRKEIDTTIAVVETLLGFRPTTSEKDKREQAITSRIFSLKGQQEKLYQYLRTIRNPRGAVERYNRTVKSILDSPMVPKAMRLEWEPKLLVDLDRYLQGKAHTASLQATTKEAKLRVERAIETLKNFGITAEEANKLFIDYYVREKKMPTVGPLERHPVLGRGRKRRRLKERMESK